MLANLWQFVNSDTGEYGGKQGRWHMFDNGQTLIAAASRNGRATALSDGEVACDYDRLLDRASRLVTLFDQVGLKQGDRLMVVMQNRLDMVLLYWATQLAGVVFAPVNWRVKPPELDYFLNDSGASAIAYCPAGMQAVAQSATAKNLAQIEIGEGSDDLGLEARISSLLVAEGLPRAKPEMLSVLLYTSGTTGPGKGVPRTHHAERQAALAHVAQNAYLSGESLLGIMPLYHTMGVRSALGMALVNGHFVCQRRFDAGQSIELIARHGVSSLYLVPTLYHDILAHESFSKDRILSVRKIGFAGAAMTEDLLLKVDEAFRPQLFVNHYGSSEIYTFTVNQNAAAKPGSAGRAGINSIIRVVPLDAATANEEVVTGELGHIIARLSSDEAFSGYWHRPDADAKVLRDGWYFTGDLGYLDADGELFVTGRADDMIISGGENILPTEIESMLSLHPSVMDVAVVGLLDKRFGQKVTAYVVASDGVDAEALDLWCRQSSLANFKRPRDYVFVDVLPRSPVGKLLRRMLVNA